VTVWQVVCPETGWRSGLYVDHAAAEGKARSIDLEIARVNGLSPHRHPVVELQVDDDVRLAHPASNLALLATRHMA
jgi:hypothetical protein